MAVQLQTEPRGRPHPPKHARQHRRGTVALRVIGLVVLWALYTLALEVSGR
jgi:hypothetical protein